MAASALDGPLRALSASQGTAFATFVQALVASIESSHAADRADLLARVDGGYGAQGGGYGEIGRASCRERVYSSV